MMQATIATAISVWALILGLTAQAADVPAAAWLTGSAAVGGIVAIGMMVRAISRTEAQKTQLIEALQSELRAAHEEIHELHDLLRRQRG